VLLMKMDACIDSLLCLERQMLEALDPAPEDIDGFLTGRAGVFAGWSLALCLSREQDLLAARAEGRNLFSEQNAHMLARKEGRRAPAECPAPSMEQLWLVDWLCDALGGGLYGELMTYSVQSLRLYASHVESCRKAAIAVG
jgi:hypothetical protein